MSIKYSIQYKNKYLQGITPNKYYSYSGTAPTMGARHCFHEYITVWDSDLKTTEPLTTVSYLKVLLEEFRWDERELGEIVITPFLE